MYLMKNLTADTTELGIEFHEEKILKMSQNHQGLMDYIPEFYTKLGLK